MNSGRRQRESFTNSPFLLIPTLHGEYAGEHGENRGEAGEYDGEVGQYDGDVGEYAEKVGEYGGEPQLGQPGDNGSIAR